MTGGAGSLGRELAEAILDLNPHSVRIFDNSEQSLARFKRQNPDPRLRFLLGDIRDKTRVEMALEEANVVYHLSAIKMIQVAFYNPIEAIKTNINGTINLLECCLQKKPEQLVFISSDKAVNPISIYGATKQIGEHLTLWAQRVQNHTKYSVCRLGNIEESEGNVFEIWMEQLEAGGPLTVTSPLMRRFMMPIKDAVSLILKATQMMKGGEVFVPEMKEYKLLELAKQYCGDVKIIGVRGKEKIHEELMTVEERQHAKWNDEYEMWVIQDETENPSRNC